MFQKQSSVEGRLFLVVEIKNKSETVIVVMNGFRLVLG